MIDVHSHILPGIDDGAQNLEESIELVKAAISNGITHIVATPHIHPGRFDNDIQSIQKAYKQLVNRTTQENLSIKISSAAEVRISVEIISMITENTVPFVGKWEGYDVMLLEMPHSHILPGSDKLIKLLLKNNIRPLIAHPERNKEVMATPRKIRPFVDQGCLLQVTAGSIYGQFGDNAKATANILLQEDLVTLIATDTHNIKNRPPNLAEGYKATALLTSKDHEAKLKQNAKELVKYKTFNEKN